MSQRRCTIICIVVCSFIVLTVDISIGLDLTTDWTTRVVETPDQPLQRVPRGLECEVTQKITNPFSFPIRLDRLESARRELKLIDPPTRQWIAPGEAINILMRVDTRKRIMDQGNWVMTAVFDEPVHAVARMPLLVWGRTDLVCNPGKVDFGKVGQGTAVTKCVTVAFAGAPNWRITSLECNNDDIETTFHMIMQPTSGGNSTRIEFEIRATTSKAAPLGTISGDIFVHVTDEMKSFRILLDGTITEATYHAPAGDDAVPCVIDSQPLRSAN